MESFGNHKSVFSLRIKQRVIISDSNRNITSSVSVKISVFFRVNSFETSQKIANMTDKEPLPKISLMLSA